MACTLEPSMFSMSAPASQTSLTPATSTTSSLLFAERISSYSATSDALTKPTSITTTTPASSVAMLSTTTLFTNLTTLIFPILTNLAHLSIQPLPLAPATTSSYQRKNILQTRLTTTPDIALVYIRPHQLAYIVNLPARQNGLSRNAELTTYILEGSNRRVWLSAEKRMRVILSRCGTQSGRT